MRKISFLITFMFVAITFSCKKGSDDSSASASTVKCLTTSIKSGSITYYTLTYDGNRNLTKLNSNDHLTGALIGSTDYQYSGANLTKQTSTSYDKNGIASGGSYTTYEYDGNGKLTKESNYDSNNVLQGYTIYTYDGSGKSTKAQSYSSANAPGNYTTYEYNSAGALISNTTWDNTTGLKTEIIRYDGLGNITSINANVKDNTTNTYSEVPLYTFTYDMSKTNCVNETLLKASATGPTKGLTSKNQLTNVYVYGGATKGQISETVLYEYSNNNTNGYPQTVKVTDNGIVSIYNLEYNCL